MSDPVLPLGGASMTAAGASVRETGPFAMLMLRAKDGTEGLAQAVKSVTGCDLPGRRAICHAGPRSAAWMSPDEFLLLLPLSEGPAAISALAAALAGRHHLVADVSDARAVFRLEGPAAEAAAATLFPVDFATLPEGELRRSRMAQVAAALWRREGGFTIVTFRSVARYAFDLLANAARGAG